jgi:hypothetical protein
MTKMRKSKVLVVRGVNSTHQHPKFTVMEDSPRAREFVYRYQKEHHVILEYDIVDVKNVVKRGKQ